VVLRLKHLMRILVAGALLSALLLSLVGCGSAPQSSGSGNFGGTGTGTGTTGTSGGSEAVSGVSLNPAQLTGGASTAVTITLAKPAPSGGLAVELKSSDATDVSAPASVNVAAGESSATATVSTTAVSAATTVTITASYGTSMAGTSLSIAPASTPTFSMSLQPSTVTVAPGQSGSSKITTKITTGYNHALTLSTSNAPSGVSTKLTPAVIPAPGAGTSTEGISVASTAATGTYSLKTTATDGKKSSSATLTLKIAGADPGTTFQGCWYQQSGHKYQGVRVSVANPGTYPFDADLYNGTSCDPSDWADEFGFGQEIKFGGFDYIFWFSDFKDQTNMSALWHVGPDTSACINYEIAPNC